MRIRGVVGAVALALVTLGTACGGVGLFRQYEYEEEMYLALDGTATMYVNSSVAALNALRGSSFDTDPNVTIDRAAVTAYFSTPSTRVTRVTVSRRSNRRFVHLRIDVADVNRLGEAAPFAWSRYDFKHEDGLYVYKQSVGSAAGKAVGEVGWDGTELVAFRLHLPSKIAYHNTSGVNRGNILVWEQPLTERLQSVPLTVDARMETQSILYRTLWLFGWTFVAVAVAFGLVIWWILRRAPKVVDGGGSADNADGDVSGAPVH
jgi:hypothetical protein